MDKLLFFQFGCLLLTAIMALMLMISRLHIHHLNRKYEISRWLLCSAMSILSLHYLLQMIFGFRAQSDDIGAVVNILFYSPVACLIAYAMINIASNFKFRRRFLIVNILGYAAILIAFTVDLAINKSLDMDHTMRLMAFPVLCKYCL